MSNQNYENHAQYVTAYHKVILPILFLTLVGSVVNLYQSWESISASTAPR